MTIQDQIEAALEGLHEKMVQECTADIKEMFEEYLEVLPKSSIQYQAMYDIIMQTVITYHKFKNKVPMESFIEFRRMD